MTPESYARSMHRAASAGDWQEVERLSRAYGWRLLGLSLRRAAAWLVGRVFGGAAGHHPLRR
ncbi:hypothetical protein [Falsiroseomonas oryzae]|uniref:hypothetical protein n=1 Tax=Falsiroseomonas oryzae TaxID=2766473 RepID=UPI0022EA4C85|nr:hypothetical protein [Roseomonas sp. MO-31]